MAQAYNFKNQVVVITGGGGGIGKAAALAFVEARAQVVILGRDQKKLKAAASEISFFGKCTPIKCDVSDVLALSKAFKGIMKKFKRIDILVNCAGIYGPIGEFHSNNLKLWEEAMGINLLGTVRAVHAVLPYMLKAKKGKIINLSGGGAVQPFPNFSVYATSKAAVVRLTENLAKEYQSRNIQVNAIAPGAINTSFLEQVLNAGPNKAGKDFYQKSVEQKHTGGDSPEQAAELILFLCSPRACRLTGKLVSAKWDNWQKWRPKDLGRINKTSEYTLRRIDNKYFGEIKA